MRTDFRSEMVRTLSRGHTRLLIIVALLTASVTAFAGVSQAAPTTAGPVKYELSRSASAVSIAVSNGSIETKDGILAIRNKAGAPVFQMPLAYRVDNRQFPIDGHTVGTTATLTPSRDKARSTIVDLAEVNDMRAKAAQIVGPQTRKQRDDEALGRFTQQLGTGMTISSLVGTAIGAVVGGVLGCVIATATTAIGCLLGGFALGASVGGTLGLILGGGGSLIGAAIQYFQTINSPFKPEYR